MAIKITPFEEREQESFNMLLYGRPKTGKTWWAAHAPKPLLINLDKGDKCLDKLPAKVKKELSIAHVDGYDDVKALLTALQTREHPYKTIIIDHLTDLQRMHKESLMAAAGKDCMNVSLWVAHIDIFSTLMRDFRDLPTDVIHIAHHQEKGGEDNEPSTIQPMLQSEGVMRSVQGTVGLIGFMMVKMLPNTEDPEHPIEGRAIRCLPDGRIDAGDRSGNLNAWETGSFAEITAKWHGTKKPAKKEETA